MDQLINLRRMPLGKLKKSQHCVYICMLWEPDLSQKTFNARNIFDVFPCAQVKTHKSLPETSLPAFSLRKEKAGALVRATRGFGRWVSLCVSSVSSYCFLIRFIVCFFMCPWPMRPGFVSLPAVAVLLSQGKTICSRKTHVVVSFFFFHCLGLHWSNLPFQCQKSEVESGRPQYSLILHIPVPGNVRVGFVTCHGIQS